MNDRLLLHHKLIQKLNSQVFLIAKKHPVLTRQAIDEIWEIFFLFPLPHFIINKLPIFINRLIFQKDNSLNLYFLAYAEKFSLCLAKDSERFKLQEILKPIVTKFP